MFSFYSRIKIKIKPLTLLRLTCKSSDHVVFSATLAHFSRYTAVILSCISYHICSGTKFIHPDEYRRLVETFETVGDTLECCCFCVFLFLLVGDRMAKLSEISDKTQLNTY